jgi:uncharacterized repeat protein (TIGR01451 family)
MEAKTKTGMRRTVLLALPLIGAAIALDLMLVTMSWAGDALGAESCSLLTAPLTRPHDPHSGVYTMYDTLTPADVPTVTYDWVEIRDSADYVWNLGGSGYADVSDPYPIGFFFPFYDDFYTHFRISEKGYVFFEKEGIPVGSGRGWPDPIPGNNLTGTDAANNFIAPFAAHLYGYPGLSHVYVRNDSSPRRTIIEFENVVWCCGRYNPRTFEIILEPDGGIQMQYLKITNFAGTLDESPSRSFVVGLENLDGSAGDVYTQGLQFIPDATDYWQDQMAIRFQPHFTGAQAIFMPSSQAIWDDPGNSITTTTNLYLGASEEVTRSFTLTHTLVVSSSVSDSAWEGGITYPTSIAAVTGTYSSTVPIVVSIPSSVTDTDDMATLTITAASFDATPFISATFTLNYGPAHRDLQIDKTLDPDIPPAPDGAFRYGLAVVNTDYADSDRAAIAHGVVVTDLLPPGVVYEDCRRTYWWHGCGSMVTTATVGSQTIVTVNLDTMFIDEVENLWLELRNTGNGVGSVVDNTAHVTMTGNVELGAGPNNHDGITFTVATTQTELIVYKDYWYDNDFVAAGQAIPFNVEFYNDGRDDHVGNVPLFDATIVDLLPENTTFSRAYLYYNGPELVPDVEGPITPTAGGPMSRTLTFAIPLVDNGWWNYARLEVWINIPPTVPIGTRLTNVVTISHGASTATSDETVEIASSYVDPFVDKEPSRDESGNVILPGPGQDYTYWISYGNRSVLSDVSNVVITDTLPPSVTLVSVSAARYLSGPVTSVSPEGLVQLTWYTGTGPGIPRSWVGQIALVVRIDEDAHPGTKLANHIVITYSDSYTPSTTADDTDVVTIEVASDLERSQKLVGDPTPDAGESVEYTLIVSNTSLANTISFTVSDVLPVGLAYLDHYTPTTGTVTTGANALLWTGEVSPTDEVTLTFRATITDTAYAGQVIRNTAIISGGGIRLERWADITIARGVFDNSVKDVSAAGEIASGDTITYTIIARNDGSTSRVVTVTDSLPPSVTLISSSFHPPTGTTILPPGIAPRAFAWTVNVEGNNSERLDFQVTVTEGLTIGVTITNVAYLDDGLPHGPLPLAKAFTIGRRPGNWVYMPLVFRDY